MSDITVRAAIAADWEALSPRLLDSPSYLYHDSRPVLGLKGLGAADGPNPPTAAALRLVRSLRERGAYVVGACPMDWQADPAGYAAASYRLLDSHRALFHGRFCRRWTQTRGQRGSALRNPHSRPGSSAPSDRRAATRGRSSESAPDGCRPRRFAAVHRAMDCLLPWTVGSFSSPAGAADYYGGQFRADSEAVQRPAREPSGRARGARCEGRRLGAVVWPGASRAQRRLRAGEYNAVPRRGGLFLWEQCRRAVREGALFLFVSSFDEVAFCEPEQSIHAAVNLHCQPVRFNTTFRDFHGLSEFYMALTMPPPSPL